MGDEAASHLARVLRIPRQIRAEKFLLIQKPPHEAADKELRKEESPPGTKRDGRSEKKQDRTRVHGVPDDSIGTGRDDGLALGDLHCRGGKSILPDDEEVNDDSVRNERVAGEGEPGGNGGRPAKR